MIKRSDEEVARIAQCINENRDLSAKEIHERVNSLEGLSAPVSMGNMKYIMYRKNKSEKPKKVRKAKYKANPEANDEEVSFEGLIKQLEAVQEYAGRLKANLHEKAKQFFLG